MTLPEHWTDQSGAKALVDAVIRRAFVNSGRLVAVFVAWETWMATDNGAYMEARFDAAINKKSRYHQHDLENSLGLFGSHLSADWTQLSVYVASWLGVMKDFIHKKMANET